MFSSYRLSQCLLTDRFLPRESTVVFLPRTASSALGKYDINILVTVHASLRGSLRRLRSRLLSALVFLGYSDHLAQHRRHLLGDLGDDGRRSNRRL